MINQAKVALLGSTAAVLLAVFVMATIHNRQHFGTVVDTAGAPIEGVHVYISYSVGRYTLHLPLDHGGPNGECIFASSATTDRLGRYPIAPPVSLPRQMLIALNPFREIQAWVRVYKPGYSAIVRSEIDSEAIGEDARVFYFGEPPATFEIEKDGLTPDQRRKHLRFVFPTYYLGRCPDRYVKPIAEQFRQWMRPEVAELAPRWETYWREQGKAPAELGGLTPFFSEILGYDPFEVNPAHGAPE